MRTASTNIPQSLNTATADEMHWKNRYCSLAWEKLWEKNQSEKKMAYFLKPCHYVQKTLLLILTTCCWTQKMNFLALKSNGQRTNHKSAKTNNCPNRKKKSAAAKRRVAITSNQERKGNADFSKKTQRTLRRRSESPRSPSLRWKHILIKEIAQKFSSGEYYPR